MDLCVVVLNAKQRLKRGRGQRSALWTWKLGFSHLWEKSFREKAGAEDCSELKTVQEMSGERKLTGPSFQAAWLLVKRKRKQKIREAGSTKIIQ